MSTTANVSSGKLEATLIEDQAIPIGHRNTMNEELHRQCPRDRTLLTSVSIESVEIEACQNCAGVWLDAGELRKLIDRPKSLGQVQESVENRATHESAGQTSTNTCPNGHGEMTRYHYAQCPGIVLDTCPTCYGIWLDDKELEKVLGRAVDPTRTKSGADSAEFQTMLVDHMKTMDRLATWKDLYRSSTARFGILGVNFSLDDLGGEMTGNTE